MLFRHSALPASISWNGKPPWTFSHILPSQLVWALASIPCGKGNRLSWIKIYVWMGLASTSCKRQTTAEAYPKWNHLESKGPLDGALQVLHLFFLGLQKGKKKISINVPWLCGLVYKLTISWAVDKGSTGKRACIAWNHRWDLNEGSAEVGAVTKGRACIAWEWGTCAANIVEAGLSTHTCLMAGMKPVGVVGSASGAWKSPSCMLLSSFAATPTIYW